MPTGASRADAALRPLAARSVVLSLLLGAHPPEVPVRDIVRTAEAFKISEATLRVALTRMVSTGDLLRTASTYRLADRLLDRQRRQDEALQPRTIAWRGRWEMAIVTVTGRRAAERADLRAALANLRLAELREGVWLRPANLRRPFPAELTPLVTRFLTRPEGPAAELAAALWDVDGWATTARSLLHAYSTATTPAPRLTAAAAIVRHLLTDPVLPPELLPAGWPAADLHSTYAAYRTELMNLVGTPPTE
jgi:phenylacetic acid degradation operon negative regulatory protein